MNASRAGQPGRSAFPGVAQALALLLLWLAGSAEPARAQTNAAASRRLANRYLVVVETSRAMQPRSAAVLDALQELVLSGMHGQMRKGDSLGLWTFNSELHTGVFPVEEWVPEEAKTVNLHVLSFLQKQKYEKAASLDKVVPTLQKVVKNSAYLTVVLISSGEDRLRGTPFDEPINQFFKQWHDSQQKARMPFVTVLRTQSGKVAQYSINSAPWPVELPALPPELQVQVVEAKPSPQPGPPAVAPAVAPLIFHGSKPTPVQPPAPEPVGTGPAGNTNQAAPPSPSAPVKTELSQPAPATPQSEAPPVTAAPAKVDIAVEPPATAPAPLPTSPVPPAIEPVEAKAEVLSTPPPPAVPAVTAPAVPAPRPQAAVQTAAAVPPAGSGSRRILWVTGLVVAAAAAGLLFLLVRRARSAPQASLITRSLDRERK